MNNKIFYISLLTLTLASGTTACRQNRTSHSKKPVPVEVMTPNYTRNATSLHYIGTLKESRSVQLSFAVAGTVESVNCTEGQYVDKGSVMATLSGNSFKEARDAAEAALNQAQDAYNRMQKVYDKGGITELQWIEIQTKLAQAKSMAAIAQGRVNDCRIVAPYNGVVGKSNLEAGMNVVPGITCITLLDVNPMNVTVPVPDNVVTSLSIGQKVSVDFTGTSAGRQADLRPATIKGKGVVSNPLSHNYTIELSVDNPRHLLLPGMVCDVYIPRNGNDSAIVLPTQTVKLADDGSHYVWIAKDGTAAKRPVKIGNFAPNGIVIDKGLKPTDKVICKGEQKVSEGTKITIL